MLCYYLMKPPSLGGFAGTPHKAKKCFNRHELDREGK